MESQIHAKVSDDIPNDNSILPIDLCFKIEDIRLFIYANSSSSKVK